MEIDVVNAKMWCNYCETWTDVVDMNFGRDYIGVCCRRCNMTYTYDIARRDDE